MVAHYAHLATAIAYVIIGIVLLRAAFHLWNCHPVNRVFLIGEYLTDGGIKLILKGWPLVFLFGLFIISCAVDHAADFFVSAGLLYVEVLEASATFEAVVSLITAGLVLGVAVGWPKWRRV